MGVLGMITNQSCSAGSYLDSDRLDEVIDDRADVEECVLSEDLARSDDLETAARQFARIVIKCGGVPVPAGGPSSTWFNSTSFKRPSTPPCRSRL